MPTLATESLRAIITTVVAEYLDDVIVGPLSLAAARDGMVRAKYVVKFFWSS